MKHYYILTGYYKKTNKLCTNCYIDLQHIVDIISYWTPMALRDKNLNLKNIKDLQFRLETSRNHNSAIILDSDPNILWSIYYV